MSREPSSSWGAHIQDPGKREQFVTMVRNSGPVLSRLRDLLIQEIEANDRKITSEDQFDNPNWAYKQAYLNGRVAADRDKLRLFSFLP